VREALRTENKKPKAILLAGGLGSSGYLYLYLKDKFAGIEIIQASKPNPWSAICRGAVMKAHDSKTNNCVISRKSRASYGLTQVEDFDPLKHQIDDREWFEPWERHVVCNSMRWYLKRVSKIVDKRHYSLVNRRRTQRFRRDTSSCCAGSTTWTKTSLNMKLKLKSCTAKLLPQRVGMTL
jgi:hypothetical protein